MIKDDGCCDNETGPGKSDGCCDSLIGASVWHRSVDGDMLIEIREQLGVTQAAFASHAGHSQPFQTQIESPGRHEITSDKAEQIARTVSYFTGLVTDRDKKG